MNPSLQPPLRIVIVKQTDSEAAVRRVFILPMDAVTEYYLAIGFLNKILFGNSGSSQKHDQRFGRNKKF